MRVVLAAGAVVTLAPATPLLAAGAPIPDVLVLGTLVVSAAKLCA